MKMEMQFLKIHKILLGLKFQEKAELQTAYDAKDYARKREQAYPNLKEFAEAYCEKEINNNSAKWDEYVTKYNNVRTTYPKP